MIFEKAIVEAGNFFLFDRRSRQHLTEMAEEAAPNSRDRFLIRLTHAAFIYYNAFDSEGWEIERYIGQASGLLREVKRYRGDRVFYTMALRMEVDMLLHSSRLHYQDAPRKQKSVRLFNEEDVRALSICDTLLKNFPPTLDPLPNAWYTSLLPLFPTFQEEVLRFYADRVKENRLDVLQIILGRIKEELVMAAGMIMAKKFLSETTTDFAASDRVVPLLLNNVREVITRLEGKMPPMLQVTAEMALPKGISQGQLEIAVTGAERQLADANLEKDMRKYTTSLLQIGILNFLRENDPGTIRSLVNTLRASTKLSPEVRQSRQYRHEEFADIPFMIGTAFLRLALQAKDDEEEDDHHFLEQSKSGLLKTLALNPHFHPAYVNLVLGMILSAEPGADEVVAMYLDNFKRDLATLDGQLFRNLALLEFQANGSVLNSEALKWLLVSYFSLGGELTKAGKMLQELKTLYTLNAHDYSVQYLREYRMALRQNDKEFIEDLESSPFHSALLFYIAHAFASTSLRQGKNEAEVSIDHGNLDQSIDLNADSLYFNAGNNSALRLVETQQSILMFALKRTEKRWENIGQNLSHRFQFYEEYLRQLKSYNMLKDRLASLNLKELVGEWKVSNNAQGQMDGTLSDEQRDRLRNRVELS